jgi:uncharacterized protein YdeI (YjbR/CyaY-like superfamily)
MDVLFFPTPDDLRAWFEANHDKATEQWVGYYKKGTGRPSITWEQSVDQALCFGWIDGIRKSIDGDSYKIRFTPRKSRSTWSLVNIKRVGELTEMGLMHPNGLKTFEQRTEDNSGIYSHENRHEIKLDEVYEQQLKANEKAWTFFQAQPKGYRHAAFHWVMSAKKDETKLKRLATLVQDSANGRTVAPLTYKPKRE